MPAIKKHADFARLAQVPRRKKRGRTDTAWGDGHEMNQPQRARRGTEVKISGGVRSRTERQDGQPDFPELS